MNSKQRSEHARRAANALWASLTMEQRRVRMNLLRSKKKKTTLEARLISKVKKTGTCWLWMGSVDGCGYGTIGDKHKTKKAHREAYKLWCGPIPEGLCVLHTCDTPKCINPKHLWVGSHLENMRDMYSKGRRVAACGEKNGASTLRTRDIKLIFKLRKKAKTQQYISKKVGCSQSRISQLLRGKGWKHLVF